MKYILSFILMVAVAIAGISFAFSPASEVVTIEAQAAVFDVGKTAPALEVIASEAFIPASVTINGLTLLELSVMIVVFFGLLSIKPGRRKTNFKLNEKFKPGFRSLFETGWRFS